MTWLGAVLHFDESVHRLEEINDGMQFERLNEAEEAAARSRIIEDQERARAARAWDNRLMQYVKDKHGIADLTPDKDSNVQHSIFNVQTVGIYFSWRTFWVSPSLFSPSMSLPLSPYSPLSPWFIARRMWHMSLS
ncbi:hypothetical protein BDN70DRAFT_16231 [Pholiota conissans]|uniref:Uncharacterized protein n=1 Tax=Pholiota conissans TaxID=109636 RepID=A0A9P5ZFH2_9AGAR|nr:hypothetical protein BDN70DRAFT_16231 [Pholiota conissans]